MDKMHVLVTGGAGFIGSHVCDALLEDGHTVICLDNFNEYYDPCIKERNIKACRAHQTFFLYRVDILDKVEVERIFNKHAITHVIHLAARAGVRPSIADPGLYARVNIMGTINLLEASKKTEHFLFGSSSSVYGDNEKIPFRENDPVDHPISPYAASKRAGELLCYTYHRLWKIPVTCLRFFTVYGPRGRPDMAVFKFIDAIEHGRIITMYGDGSSKRDYTYVGDIVQGVRAALTKNFSFEIINLGNSRPIVLRELIAAIEKALRKKAVIVQQPMPKGDVPLTYADIGKAKKLLDYIPSTTLEQGIKKTVAWYRKRV